MHGCVHVQVWWSPLLSEAAAMCVLWRAQTARGRAPCMIWKSADSSEAEASTVRRRLREGRAQRQHCPSMPMRTSESHCRSESTRRAHANTPEDGGRGVDPRSSLSKRGIRPSGALDTTLFTHLSSCACATLGRRPDRRVALGVEGTSRVESMDEEQSRAEAEEAWNGRRREGEEGGWDVPRTGHGETGTYTLPPPPLPQAPAHRPARSPSSPPVRPEEAQSTSHGPFPSTPGDAGRRTRASRAGRGGAGGDWEVRSLIPARGVSLVRLEACCGGRSVYDGEKIVDWETNLGGRGVEDAGGAGEGVDEHSASLAWRYVHYSTTTARLDALLSCA
ncbi:hypothetical protein C8Q80DRAFT_441475 [Daedaleopsis nitida]|nr:hypothetical protein C8Q80DRAFT_441475 [Daedaleopsis nitida]